MASITKARDRWLVRVRRKGQKPISKTFSTKVLAQAWAKRQESDIEHLSAGIMPSGSEHTVGKLIERYEEEVGRDKPFGRNKAAVLRTLRQTLKSVQVAQLTPARIVQYIRDDRGVKDVTASIELTYLKSVLKVARALWQLPVHPSVVDDAREMLHHLGMLARGQERDRRPTGDEISRIKDWLAWHSETLTPDHIDFILSSCFRPPSEITRLLWQDLNEHDKTIVIHDRKDPRRKLGNHQTVPLLGDCMDIIRRQPRSDEPGAAIFPVNGGTWSTVFPRACRALGIQDLRLYDLRHEAISRLVEAGKHSIAEMMLITGHKDPKQLMRYTQLRARNLHR